MEVIHKPIEIVGTWSAYFFLIERSERTMFVVIPSTCHCQSRNSQRANYQPYTVSHCFFSASMIDAETCTKSFPLNIDGKWRRMNDNDQGSGLKCTKVFRKVFTLENCDFPKL